MRLGLSVLAVLALGACDPKVPDSAAGAGFDSYSAYSARRETALHSEMTVRPPVQDGAQGGTLAPMSALDPQAGVVPATDNPGLSDEQNFAAVASRETIESDRERLQAQRQEYIQVAPTAIPSRSGDSGPNIVQFALSTTNRVGEERYRRGMFGKSQFARNCGRYASSDLAQEAFLKAGGPQRDRLNLDPDGDGFACYWDPTPFRQAVN
ncbi:MAG: hypothetical protein JXJ18_00510 [Rhodobacteraceae bacterium]|nr:hypothetical protein [Paracoccaceae bacterium]